jgi:hypothetical protein
MIFNCNINIALVLIATTGSFAPTSFASEVPEASTRVLSWVVQTDEEVRFVLLVQNAYRIRHELNGGKETFGKQSETTSSLRL